VESRSDHAAEGTNCNWESMIDILRNEQLFYGLTYLGPITLLNIALKIRKDQE
jgi:hypothetical protein